MISTLNAVTINAPPPAESGQWVHLMPGGPFRGKDGRGPWDAADLPGIIATSRQHAGGRPIPVDYDHQIDLLPSRGGQAPAAGWIVDMQGRADGIWGLVEWTPRAKALLEAREYRFLSPVIAHGHDGKVTGLLRASLTNNPNLPQLAALNNAGSPMKPDELMQSLSELLGLADGSAPEEILAGVRALTAATPMSVDPAKYVPIELFQEAVKIANSANAGISRQSAEIAVNQAQKERLVMPFMRDWAINLCMVNKPAFDAFVQTAGQSINQFLGELTAPIASPPGGWGGAAPGQEGAAQPTDVVLASLGLTPDDAKKYGARRA